MNSLYEGYRGQEYAELRERYEAGYKERNDGLNSGVDTYLILKSFVSISDISN